MLTTAANLVIDALVQSEWELSQRVSELQVLNEQLVTLVADLAMERAGFETLARRWLRSLCSSRAAADSLRDEIRRYTASRAC